MSRRRGQPRRPHPMTNRGDMVFLDLLVFFPGFATGDRQQLVDLASVVDVVACNGGDNVEKRLQLAPVHRSRTIQRGVVRQLIETPQPAGVRGLSPGDYLVKVALARLDRVPQAARPVDMFPMPWLRFERVRPVDVAPASDVLQRAEGRAIAAWRDEQGFVDAYATHVVGQHLESLLDHKTRELASGTHTKRPRAMVRGGVAGWGHSRLSR